MSIEDLDRVNALLQTCILVAMLTTALFFCAVKLFLSRHVIIAKFTGKNPDRLAPKHIIDQMLEKRPLPIGRPELEAWADRIVSGACVTASVTSQKWTLFNMLMHLGPTEDHKCDGHYIQALRVCAIKEGAHIMAMEYRDKGKAELAADEAAKGAH